MIVAILILIAGLILNLLSFFLGLFNFIIPDEIVAAIEKLFSYTAVLQGIFPVNTLLSAVLVIISAFLAIYSIRIVLWLLGFIPGMTHRELPSYTKNEVDLSGGRVVNLRNPKNWRKGRIDKRMRF